VVPKRSPNVYQAVAGTLRSSRSEGFNVRPHIGEAAARQEFFSRKKIDFQASPFALALWLTNQMKRFLVLILCISFPGLSVAQAAPGKIGSPCNKINSLTHVAGVTLVCATSGKKLIWKKIQNGKPSKAGTAPQAPSPSPTVSPQNGGAIVDSLRSTAFSSVHGIVCSQSHPHINLEKKIGANVPFDVQDVINPELDRVLNCFDTFFESTISLKVIYITEKDTDLLSSDVPQIIGQSELTNLTSTLNRYRQKEWGATGGSGGGTAGHNGDTDNYWLVLHLASYTNVHSYAVKGIMHEFTHILQLYGRRGAHTTSEAEWYANMPGYFLEGGAETLAYTFTSSSLTSYNFDINKSQNDNTRGIPSARNMKDLGIAITILKTIMAPSDSQTRNLQYPLGSLVCEYILGKYGIDKYLALMKGASRYPNWNDNLQATLGISESEFMNVALAWGLPLWNSATA